MVMLMICTGPLGLPKTKASCFIPRFFLFFRTPPVKRRARTKLESITLFGLESYCLDCSGIQRTLFAQWWPARLWHRHRYCTPAAACRPRGGTQARGKVYFLEIEKVEKFSFPSFSSLPMQMRHVLGISLLWCACCSCKLD